MLNLLAWYIVVTLTGLLAFPLTHTLFPALADRGYSLSRALGLLVWGYLFWIMASLGVVQNDPGGILLALALLTALSGWLFWRKAQAGEDSPLDWIKSNRRLVIRVEVVFLVALVVFAIFRSTNADAFGTEKPMEMMFINSILKSPTFPPQDAWLSGYAISYYYFGYVIAAMLARITTTSGPVAFNLMLCLLFALSALGAYGIVYNLLALFRRYRRQQGRESLSLPLLGPLFLLIVSNVVGFLTVLHRRGLFWTVGPGGTLQSRLWTWLDLRDLSQPPALPLKWIPDQFWWWWGASRVVRDYDLHGNFLEIIDEFPAFSYILGDVHPHVLAMPFVLLAIGAVLNLFSGGWGGETNIFGLLRPRIRPLGFIFAGLIFGGLAFLNTWDFPIYLTLLCGAYLLLRVREAGWRWARLAELFEFVIPLGLLSVLLYAPFYAGFSSQASGFLPNLVNPTRGTYIWVMFGTLLVPLILYMVYLRWGEGLRIDWTTGFILGVGLVFVLWALAWGVTAIGARTAAGQALLQSQGVQNLLALFSTSARLRELAFGGLGTLLVLIAASAGFILNLSHRRKPAEVEPGPQAHTFALLMMLVAALLVLAPEFFYIHDQFGDRINTVFKFYYQAWILWSLAAAFGSAVLFMSLRRSWKWLFSAGFAVLMVIALTYPVLGGLNKSNNLGTGSFLGNLAQDISQCAAQKHTLCTTHSFQELGLRFSYTLDAFPSLRGADPDMAAAIAWLNQSPPGVIAEASDPASSYRDYSRASEYSGLPGVLGWVGHERQWRGGDAEMASRQDDLTRLYQTQNWDEAKGIIDQYGIRYIIVGNIERTRYHVSDEKFKQHLAEGMRQGNLVIYVVP